MNTTKSVFVTVRVEPAIDEALSYIRRVYGLRSRSEAIRTAVRQVALEQRLTEAETKPNEVYYGTE